MYATRVSVGVNDESNSVPETASAAVIHTPMFTLQPSHQNVPVSLICGLTNSSLNICGASQSQFVCQTCVPVHRRTLEGSAYSVGIVETSAVGCHTRRIARRLSLASRCAWQANNAGSLMSLSFHRAPTIGAAAGRTAAST